MTTDVGVVVGRFQISNLSEGHIYLIERALTEHRNVVVLIGSSQEWGTQKNPMNYATRAQMILATYPEVTTCPLPDFPGMSKRWSHHLDATIRSLGWDLGDVVLYAGRDSFAPHYEGDFQVVICDSGISHISGTNIREEIGKQVLASEDFRSGVIYAALNPYSLEAQTKMYQKLKGRVEEEHGAEA